MKTIHKQVKYKDFEVDEEMLPVIKELNENGIITLYSCCGLDEDGDKTKTMEQKLDKNLDTYIVIENNPKGQLFINTLLMVQDIILKDSNKIYYPFLNIGYSYKDKFRYDIHATMCCSFETFILLINTALDSLKRANI